MTELIERVARLESQGEATREAIGQLRQAVEQSTQTMQEMTAQVAALLAVSQRQHTPESCPHRADIRDCREALWYARGGGRVIIWLLGGGLLSLGTLIGVLVRV